MEAKPNNNLKVIKYLIIYLLIYRVLQTQDIKQYYVSILIQLKDVVMETSANLLMVLENSD